MFLADSSFVDILDEIVEYSIMFLPTILFIVFLILFIVNVRKAKQDRKKRVKAIVFGVLSGFFLMIVGVEIFLVILMALAVAHM